MAKSVLSEARFHNEDAAFEYVEAQLWPNGPVCPHCGETAKIGRLTGKTTRPGLRKCYACRKPFTVRMGSIFEDSHLPLRLWLQAIHLLCSSKKGISTRQLQRTLGCGMKTAWHLGHRIRFAMDPGFTGPMGGEGKTVEIDDMELGRSPKTRKRPEGRKANMKYMGKFWLVPEWLDNPVRKVTMPLRIISMETMDHRRMPGADPEFLVSDPVPRYVFDGRIPPAEAGKYVVIEGPQIVIPRDESLH